jgi:seryl-tRNA synthetase
MGIPNLPYHDVPDGADETANVEIHRWGSPRNFAAPPREHFEIPAAQADFDFEAAGRLSGSRFVVMKRALPRLHRALAQFMLDTHVTRHGLTEVWTPVLVRDEAMLGTGQLPKFAEDSYQTTNGWWLIPTAEVTLTNLVAGKILDEAELPIRMTAHTACFRSEAGSAGKDTAGMLRQHQFEKVEMVSITRPEDSRDEQERMRGCAEAILEALGLPYRTVVLATGDLGFGARRTFDLEVWLPGQGTYREISSVSDCGAFQARRMNARFRRGEGARPEFVHTLNGSGLAVGRTLIAVLENGQEADGSVTLPPVLAPYLGGQTRITEEGVLA